MDLAYDAASFIASRAGAMSIAELGLVGKPTLLVPSPMSRRTTRPRTPCPSWTGTALSSFRTTASWTRSAEVRSLLDDPGACHHGLSTAMARTARPDAADRVVDEVLSVLSLDITRG